MTRTDLGLFVLIASITMLGFIHISNVQKEDVVREKAVHAVTESMESQGIKTDSEGRMLVICKNCAEKELRCLPDTKENWLAYLECEE